MPMEHCNPRGRYQNYFLTVPDRGFSKEDLVSFIDSWRSDYTYLEVCREPYGQPNKEWSHHYHAGLCFHRKVGFLKFVKACNKSKLFSGMDFRQPLVAKHKSAKEIFHQYFTDPSKYKALDEHPMLVRDTPPEPPGGPCFRKMMRQWRQSPKPGSDAFQAWNTWMTWCVTHGIPYM